MLIGGNFMCKIHINIGINNRCTYIITFGINTCNNKIFCTINGTSPFRCNPIFRVKDHFEYTSYSYGGIF